MIAAVLVSSGYTTKAPPFSFSLRLSGFPPLSFFSVLPMQIVLALCHTLPSPSQESPPPRHILSLVLVTSSYPQASSYGYLLSHHRPPRAQTPPARSCRTLSTMIEGPRSPLFSSTRTFQLVPVHHDPMRRSGSKLCPCVP